MSLWSPAIRDVLTEERLMELGPGRPHEKMQKKLAVLSSRDLFVPAKIFRPEFAEACRAALWLYHDFLDESHAISQSITTMEGSYWHAIMHRREPDPSNAAYWFRRVGSHPIFEALGKDALELGLPLSCDPWDPYGFIDLCEKHRGAGTPAEMTLRRVQRREWELLFNWCFERAVTSQ